MIAEETSLKGCFVLKPKIFNDDRGYFFESYNKSLFNNLINLEVNFVQDNQSYSKHGVLRGLHYQKGDNAQAKLVRVSKGEVLDVAVDLRKSSPTFLKHETILLSKENKKQLYIPRGFAHGFIVLSDSAIFNYKCDNYYDKGSEGGIIYNDPTLNIDWRLDPKSYIVSGKDIVLPTVKQLF